MPAPEAPAPAITILARSRSLPTTLRAFRRPAATAMPVACWSLSSTGTGRARRSRYSTAKHWGALTSSSTTAPKVGVRSRTISVSSSGSRVSTANGKASMFANVLNDTARASSMGRAAGAGTRPKPYRADASVTRATASARQVSSNEASSSSAMDRQHAPTPGVYSRESTEVSRMGTLERIPTSPRYLRR